jgi:hypothetical protein
VSYEEKEAVLEAGEEYIVIDPYMRPFTAIKVPKLHTL